MEEIPITQSDLWSGWRCAIIDMKDGANFTQVSQNES